MSDDEVRGVLLRERCGSVLTFTMHRPELYNALNDDLRDQLLACLKDAARDAKVRCLVLTGSGRAFSSGQDLRDVTIGNPDAVGRVLRQQYNPIALLMQTMEKPIIAGINGPAAGAGLSLALACDMRIASDLAKLNLAFTNIGLVPDCGACFTLPQLIGRAATLELAYTGRTLDADEALRLGLVSRVVPHADLNEALAELAAAVAARPTLALGLTKRAINRAITATLEESLEYEALCQEIAASSHDAGEGVAAFREKRLANFEGR